MCNVERKRFLSKGWCSFNFDNKGVGGVVDTKEKKQKKNLGYYYREEYNIIDRERFEGEKNWCSDERDYLEKLS